MGQPNSDLPLDGITVVALEQAVAAPLATRHLADMGARVIKIERVGEGDFARHYDQAVHGQASHFVWLNRSKESIAVDVKSEAGRQILLDLVARADVFLQNLAPDAAARLGFGAEELRDKYPRLIVIDMSGYGSAGPRRERKAYDMLVQAETGMISVTGTPETATKTGIPVSDIAAGMYALTSILSALFRRERTGKGALVEVSMFDSTVEWLGHPMYMKMYADKQIPRVGPRPCRDRSLRFVSHGRRRNPDRRPERSWMASADGGRVRARGSGRSSALPHQHRARRKTVAR